MMLEMKVNKYNGNNLIFEFLVYMIKINKNSRKNLIIVFFIHMIEKVIGRFSCKLNFYDKKQVKDLIFMCFSGSLSLLSLYIYETNDLYENQSKNLILLCCTTNLKKMNLYFLRIICHTVQVQELYNINLEIEHLLNELKGIRKIEKLRKKKYIFNWLFKHK